MFYKTSILPDLIGHLVALQWVDCVSQLLRIYPFAFEFSSVCIFLLCKTCISCFYHIVIFLFHEVDMAVSFVLFFVFSIVNDILTLWWFRLSWWISWTVCFLVVLEISCVTGNFPTSSISLHMPT